MAVIPRGAPIWAEPAPGTRRPRFTRDQIALTALRIADEEGFQAVSMRRVANELDAGTMTLYRYVRTKDDLLALMDDALMYEVLVPEGQLPRGWRAGISAIAHRTRLVFSRHPWALLSLQGARLGPNSMRHIEQSLTAVDDAPTDVAGKLELIGLVDDYVMGHVLRAGEMRRRQSSQAGADPAAARAAREFAEAQFRSGLFPRLAALLADRNAAPLLEHIAGDGADDDLFERGLQTVLEGVERRMRP